MKMAAQESWIMLYESPDTIMTKRDPQFVSKIIVVLYASKDIKLVRKNVTFVDKWSNLMVPLNRSVNETSLF